MCHVHNAGGHILHVHLTAKPNAIKTRSTNSPGRLSYATTTYHIRTFLMQQHYPNPTFFAHSDTGSIFPSAKGSSFCTVLSGKTLDTTLDRDLFSLPLTPGDHVHIPNHCAKKTNKPRAREGFVGNALPSRPWQQHRSLAHSGSP